jgi:hypothetical protein
VASLKTIRNALAAQITAQCGITCSPRMPDQVNPPQIAILPGAPYAKYGLTLGEHTVAAGLPHVIPVATEYNLIVAVFASRASSVEDAQDTVDTYLGFEPSTVITSVPEAIAFDPSLGSVVEYCECVQVQAYGDVEIAGQHYFQGRIVVSVSAHQDLS